MPADSLLVAIGVCMVFLVFAFVVAWVDHTTTRWLSTRAIQKQGTHAAYPHDHKAA